MKRSEMVKILQETIHHHMNCSHECCMTDRDVSSNVLQVLEDNGMLPPDRYRSKDWQEKGMTYSEWIALPSKVNEWEDETKD